jgi:hypothetical protein
MRFLFFPSVPCEGGGFSRARSYTILHLEGVERGAQNTKGGASVRSPPF